MQSYAKMFMYLITYSNSARSPQPYLFHSISVSSLIQSDPLQLSHLICIFCLFQTYSHPLSLSLSFKPCLISLPSRPSPLSPLFPPDLPPKPQTDKPNSAPGTACSHCGASLPAGEPACVSYVRSWPEDNFQLYVCV